jgi:hypothetical protein
MALRSGVPAFDPAETPLEIHLEGYNDLVDRIGSSEMTTWAACTQGLAFSPLPCRTGAVERRCHDGLRACGSVQENTYEPFMELDFHLYEPPNDGNSYLFALHFRLPVHSEYGPLFFHSLTGDVVENRGWRVEVFDKYHEPLTVQPLQWDAGSNVVEHTDGLRDVTHHMLPPTAEDSDYKELSRARFIRITLIGEYRQIWIDRVDAFFRHIIADGPLPPPPPSPIPSPLSPPAPPDPPFPPPLDSCTIFPNRAYRESQANLLWEVGCGFTRDECCGHARAQSAAGQNVNGFLLSAAGCCDMLSILTLAAPTEDYQFGASCTGVL